MPDWFKLLSGLDAVVFVIIGIAARNFFSRLNRLEDKMEKVIVREEFDQILDLKITNINAKLDSKIVKIDAKLDSIKDILKQIIKISVKNNGNNGS